MGKIDSILELQSWGFNIPNLLLTIPVPVGGSKAKNALIQAWIHQRVRCEQRGIKRVSIRTEKLGHTLCPHHPNIPLSQVSRILGQCILAGYSIYIFEGIDPADCKVRGNIYRDTQSSFVELEVLNGPGTVRDLEHSSGIMRISFKEAELREDCITPIVKKFLSQPELHNRILEWSIYNKPVGHLQQHEIYWEHRPWS
jgi:hypothetical protein